MRIGIYDPYLDSLSGGEKYILTAASCLANHHAVTVFWDNASLKEAAQKKFGIDLSNVAFASNIFSPHISLWSRLYKSNFFDAIIYLSDGSIPIVATKLYLHFQFPTEWINGNNIKNKLKFYRVTNVICNSQFTKSYIDKTYHINSVVLYPPASEFSEMKREKTNCILTVGRFADLGGGKTFKKQEIMIDTFKKMINTGLKNWKFILVISFKNEDAENIRYLKKKIENYPIEIVENAVYDELQQLYAQSKIYWHAAGFGEDIQKHPELVEHFGISTVQAMEQGVVPVVINLGGQKEIVDNGKNGFLWNTVEECITKTELLIQNDALMNKLSKAAVIKSHVFSVQNFCQALQKIIL